MRSTQDYPILLTPSLERSECARMNKPFLGLDISHDAVHWRDLLCTLLGPHFWGFVESFAPMNGDTRWFHDTFSRLSVWHLKHLCGTAISVAERCTIYYAAVKTVSATGGCN